MTGKSEKSSEPIRCLMGKADADKILRADSIATPLLRADAIDEKITNIQVVLIETLFGKVCLSMSGSYLLRLSFTDDVSQEIEQLGKAHPDAKIDRCDRSEVALPKDLFALRQPGAEQPLRLLPNGTDFQFKVWDTLLRIPPGRVATYGQVTRAIGKPTAARAVGNAVGKNPIAFLIPCHRVVPAVGVIGNYHWGKDLKLAMLVREISCQDAPF